MFLVFNHRVVCNYFYSILDSYNVIIIFTYLVLSPSCASLHIGQHSPSIPLFPPPARSPLSTVFCVISDAYIVILPRWVASPSQNPPPLSWLGTGADSLMRLPVAEE